MPFSLIPPFTFPINATFLYTREYFVLNQHHHNTTFKSFWLCNGILRQLPFGRCWFNGAMRSQMKEQILYVIDEGQISDKI